MINYVGRKIFSLLLDCGPVFVSVVIIVWQGLAVLAVVLAVLDARAAKWAASFPSIPAWSGAHIMVAPNSY